MNDAFDVLELDSQATFEDVQKWYGLLKLVWNPDRYVAEPALYKLACRRSEELDQAYETIVKLFASKDAPAHAKRESGESWLSKELDPTSSPSDSRWSEAIPDREIFKEQFRLMFAPILSKLGVKTKGDEEENYSASWPLGVSEPPPPPVPWHQRFPTVTRAMHRLEPLREPLLHIGRVAYWASVAIAYIFRMVFSSRGLTCILLLILLMMLRVPMVQNTFVFVTQHIRELGSQFADVIRWLPVK